VANFAASFTPGKGGRYALNRRLGKPRDGLEAVKQRNLLSLNVVADTPISTC
jgi:hypothetical protein